MAAFRPIPVRCVSFAGSQLLGLADVDSLRLHQSLVVTNELAERAHLHRKIVPSNGGKSVKSAVRNNIMQNRTDAYFSKRNRTFCTHLK